MTHDTGFKTTCYLRVIKARKLGTIDLVAFTIFGGCAMLDLCT